MYYNKAMGAVVCCAITLLFLLTVYSACVRDNCTANLCANEGVCVNGKCACLSGYEGEHCEAAWNEKFAGRWHADDSANKVAQHNIYPIEVSTRFTRDSFYIYGFGDTVNEVLCIRNTYSKFSFIADRKVDSFLTIKSGNGYADSINGGVKGSYLLQRKLLTKDTLVTVNFAWKR